MAAVRSLVRGLSTEDLEVIRDSLADGRRPKVVFTESAGQVAGQSGQVVALADPELSEEWVVVRFGRDELPFSPADLAMSGRRATERGAEPAGSRSGARRARGQQEAAAAAEPSPAIVGQVKVGHQPEAVAASGPEQQEEKVKVSESPVSTVEAVDAPAQLDDKPARRGPGRPAKPKPAAALTVTLAYADGEWTVAATQGTKPLAKPYLVRPSEALKMVGMLDVPGVHEAVEHILAAERADAEQQAQRLRAELAEVEAKLAELTVAD